MTQLGAYEAKTNLSSLLDRVEAGEAFTITKHGRPVARLVPAVSEGRELSVDKAIDGLRVFRRGHRLGAASIRSLIDDGRRR